MSKKFCSVPWRELTFSSQNQYSVCCKWDESKSVGLVDSNNSINEHWNGKLMKDLRQKFINGDNIPECAWCWKDEKANKVSARLRRNQHYYGQADIIFSSNTMHHIEDINEVVKGMDLLLKDDGTIITEDPSLKEMIIKNAYDQIYAEHMYIWSLHSITSLFERYKMEVYKIENNDPLIPSYEKAN